MTLESALTILSLVTATLILVIGIVLLTDWYLPGQVPDNYRYTIGGTMTLYALYRLLTARKRIRRQGPGGEEGDADR